MATYIRKCKEEEFDLFDYDPAYTASNPKNYYRNAHIESLDHRARDDTMSLLPSLEKTYMAIAKNRVNKKSLRKMLKAGAVNKSKRDLDLAREEEEAIAQMVKDFRRQEQRKKKRAKATVVSVSTARAQFGQIINRIAQNNERFVITYRGEPQMVIMSISDFTKITGIEL